VIVGLDAADASVIVLELPLNDKIGVFIAEAARDVGQAMAKNPVALIIPCHRVLAAGGKVGVFSAPGGSAAKIRMLALEAIHLEPPAPAQQSFGF
jgi:methylated-DNA-[protein]-cysteine S-methyltransferase